MFIKVYIKLNKLSKYLFCNKITNINNNPIFNIKIYISYLCIIIV